MSNLGKMFDSIATMGSRVDGSRHIPKQLSMIENNGSQRFRVIWKDLTYTATANVFGGKTKIILNGVSGFFESGQITGIMGPSGCGKSTLLGCIAGHKNNGLSGSITISTNSKMKFAFIVQENHILPHLTVRESLLFASQIKNGPKADHHLIVEDVIGKLMIERCADNYPKRCSGGQLKRILIGLELVSKPNILILDEPTSGLDSVTTWQLINNLIELTKGTEPVAVVVTIHQPSARLFNQFNKIYLLSCEGQCVYNGPPQSMARLFTEIGLLCPQFTNISDFGLEVASNDFGRAKLLTLSTIMKIDAMNWTDGGYPISVDKKYDTIRHTRLLTVRSLICMIRDPLNIPLRSVGYVVSAVVMALLYGPTCGYINGCVHEFAIGDGTSLLDKWKEIGSKMFDNVALLAFTVHFAWFNGIFPVLLMFPIELNVFLQEYGNGYYSAFSYFASKVMSDHLVSLILPNLGSLIIFFMTGQYFDSYWRLFSFLLIFILVTLNSSSLGFMIGAFLANYPSAVAFVGMLSLVPIILLSGVMIPIKEMPVVFQWLSYTDFMRFGHTSEVVTTFGFDRCIQTIVAVNVTDLYSLIPTDKMMAVIDSEHIDAELLVTTIDEITGRFSGDDNRSIVLESIVVGEYDYYFAIAMLILHIIVYRVLTYLFILRKVKN